MRYVNRDIDEIIKAVNEALDGVAAHTKCLEDTLAILKKIEERVATLERRLAH